MPSDPPSPPPRRDVVSLQDDMPTVPYLESPFLTSVDNLLNRTTVRKIPPTPLPPQTPLPTFDAVEHSGIFNSPDVHFGLVSPGNISPGLQSYLNTPIQTPQRGNSPIPTNSQIPETTRSNVGGTPGWLQNCMKNVSPSEPVDSGSENTFCESVVGSPVFTFQTPKPGRFESIDW